MLNTELNSVLEHRLNFGNDQDNSVLIEELNRIVRKYDDEIAQLKQFSDYDRAIVSDLQRRRDQHYERLCEIDGLTPMVSESS